MLPTRYDNLAEAEPGLTWCDQVPGWPLPLPETQASVLGMAKRVLTSLLQRKSIHVRRAS